MGHDDDRDDDHDDRAGDLAGDRDRNGHADAPILRIDALSHRYGGRLALAEVSLAVRPGEVLAFLGPNGSGKTTLFRILSTLLAPQAGRVLFRFASGADGSGGELSLADHRDAIRRHLGVVFQHPALDNQLSAEENLRHHAHLYGIAGRALPELIERQLGRFGLAERRRERVSTFSGGMKRRVELAKALLTRPRLLLMDEPSTGLDPSARRELWAALDAARRDDGVTVLLTTHLMDEAERCDRVAVLDAGRLVALDAPSALKARVGGDVLTLTGPDPEALAETLRARFGLPAQRVGATLRVELARAHEQVAPVIDALPGLIDSVSVGKPTLEDVFIHLTGHRFEDEVSPAAEGAPGVSGTPAPAAGQ